MGDQLGARGNIGGPILDAGDVQHRGIDMGLDGTGDQLDFATVAVQLGVMDCDNEFDDDADPAMPPLISPSDSEGWTSYRNDAEEEDQTYDDEDLPQVLDAAIRGLASRIAMRNYGPGGGDVSTPGGSIT